MFALLRQRHVRAFGTIPGTRDWLELLLVCALFAAVVIPFGLATGFLQLTGPKDSVVILLAYAAVALVFPGIAEEWVFRVLLVPHHNEPVTSRTRWGWYVGALVLFVLWHPLNAWLFLPWTRPLFYRPDFLVVAGLLGLAATVLYQRSGSIWPGVAFHWAVDVGWKLFCGGQVITPGLYDPSQNAQAYLELMISVHSTDCGYSLLWVLSLQRG